jgi:hypothetical protein
MPILRCILCPQFVIKVTKSMDIAYFPRFRGHVNLDWNPDLNRG